MSTYAIKPLVVGLNRTDQGVMTYLNHYGEQIHLPIYVFALMGGEKKILIDSGLEQVMVSEADQKQAGVTVMDFLEALNSIGWKPEEVDAIIHTHLHNDHCENDYRCTEAVIYVQKKELEFMGDPHPLDHRYFDDVLDDVKELVTLEGDVEIFPGIRVLFTPGHTPGGQSVVVDTKDGSALITGFCCNEKNFPKGRPAIIPGVHLDAREAYDSLRKVVDYGADILLPLHDLSVARRGDIT